MSLADVEYEKKVLLLSAETGWFNPSAWARYTRAIAETPDPRPLTREAVDRVVRAQSSTAPRSEIVKHLGRELSPSELRICRETGCEPQAFAAQKARVMGVGQ